MSEELAELAAAGREHMQSEWTGERPVLERVRGDIRSMRVSPDGDQLVIRTRSGKALFWAWFLVGTAGILFGICLVGFVATHWQPVMLLAGLGFAGPPGLLALVVFSLGGSTCCFRRHGEVILFQVVGRPAVQFPAAAVQCVKPWGPLTFQSHASVLGMNLVGALASAAGGVGMMSDPSDVLVPQLHVLLHGAGRICLNHGASQGRIWQRAALLARFLGVPVEDQINVPARPAN